MERQSSFKLEVEGGPVTTASTVKIFAFCFKFNATSPRLGELRHPIELLCDFDN